MKIAALRPSQSHQLCWDLSLQLNCARVSDVLKFCYPQGFFHTDLSYHKACCIQRVLNALSHSRPWHVVPQAADESQVIPLLHDFGCIALITLTRVLQVSPAGRHEGLIAAVVHCYDQVSRDSCTLQAR